MTVTYSSTAPGRYSGVEIDDEFTAVGWQTAGHRVGRFRRSLSATEQEALAGGLHTARDAGVPPSAGGARRPGAVTERVRADDLPDLAVTGDPPAGFAPLVDALRALLEDLAESPVAAVELMVTGSPPRAALHHVGDEPMAVRMADLTVRATVFGPDSAIVDSATHAVDPPDVGDEIGPGWALTLADDLGVPAVPTGGFATVTVGRPELDVLGDGVLRPVEWGWMSE
ncbi:MAG TPA: hypothetical protein VIC62_19610 [Nakamurella sp.]|jgi:hypothetical protein